MKLTFFEIGKRAVFPHKIQHPPNGCHVTLTCILGVNEDVIQIDNNKDIEFLGQDFIDIDLEVSRGVG